MTQPASLCLSAAVAAAVLLVQACAAESAGASAERTGVALGEPLRSMSARAREDAAKTTGIPAERWQVRRAEAVTWPDGSLGCPMPGRLYTQALVRGFRVQIAADAQVRDYHAGPAAQPSFCPADRVAAPLPARGDY